MADQLICVEVVYALPERQQLLTMEVPAGLSLREVVKRSGLDQQFPGLDLAQVPLGIYGKAVTKPDTQVAEDGDRIELYRPLIADPKAARKNRADKARKSR